MYKLFNKIFNNIGFISALTRFDRFNKKNWEINIYFFERNFRAFVCEALAGQVTVSIVANECYVCYISSINATFS